MGVGIPDIPTPLLLPDCLGNVNVGVRQVPVHVRLGNALPCLVLLPPGVEVSEVCLLCGLLLGGQVRGVECHAPNLVHPVAQHNL